MDRKRCLREMVYISTCHRDLFLFLWGFTPVTKLCFQDFFFFQKALEVFIICYRDCFVGKTFLFFKQIFDSGFKLDILRGAIL